jgi:glucose/mannose-6-phosphate isomerase
MAALDRAAIAALDSRGMFEDVLGLPSQLEDALWRVQSAGLEPYDTRGGLVVAGMGGSAIGGALARAALGDHASRPIFVTGAYGLPPWTTPDTMVLCCELLGRYRGDTRLLRVGRCARSAPNRSSPRAVSWPSSHAPTGLA